MDPISAAGIGLSITSLTLQVFAGCIKGRLACLGTIIPRATSSYCQGLRSTGYQLFADAEGMPAAYQHLRVRLRIEETRLLNWGQKIGLVEELLDSPSRALKQNRNLIIDILLEIQALFRGCIAIQANFEHLVPPKPIEKGNIADVGRAEFDQRFPTASMSMLKKTLRFLEKSPQVPRRLQWALVKKEKLEGLIEKLIGYNASIEALLDSSAIDQLQLMQQQTYMALLQLNSNVVELKEISRAVQIESKPSTGSLELQGESTEGPTQAVGTDIARLAEFKARQLQIDAQPSDTILKPIESSAVNFDDSDESRSEAFYNGENVWIEWKSYEVDSHPDSMWTGMLEDRIKKLAALLGSHDKPPQFNAPHCLGYFQDDTSDRYGFLYSKPPNVAPETAPTALLQLIQSSEHKPPSLTKRISLAHAIARCLMYLHSVNWLHKGLRSNNVIFFVAPGEVPEYDQPLIAGFEYARPDFPDEATEPPPEHSEHDFYRHPDVIRRTMSRSQKSHDIYSLGVVLVEIAYWKPISKIVDFSGDSKAARSRVRKIRSLLLTADFLESIASAIGEVYAETVEKCLTGEQKFGVPKDCDQSDAEVGLRIQEAFAEHVVGRLHGIRT